MATVNLSEYNSENIPAADNMSFGIIASEWNQNITGKLLEGAYNTLIKHGVLEKNIIIKMVPGSFELTAGGVYMAENTNVDAVICVGCVIRGETPHFDYICQGVTQGITSLNVQYGIPFIYCVLTTENIEQAKDRSGGKHGNKGDEAAITAIKMVALKNEMKNEL